MAKKTKRDFLTRWWSLVAIVIIVGVIIGFAGASYDSYYTKHHMPAPASSHSCNCGAAIPSSDTPAEAAKICNC